MLAPLTPAAAHALLSPSARVLVASAAPDAGVSVAAALPWSDVHWPTLMSLTSFERAEAQVFRLLRAAPVGAVPDDVHRAMQGIFRVAVFRAAELGEAAGMAADVLHRAGVGVLWLKGAALAMQCADEFSLRSMGDLDLLVPRAQHEAARAALRAVGWADGSPADAYAQHHHDAPMLRRGGIRLELHSGLFAPGHPFADESAEQWLARGIDVAWGERQVRVLPAVWHLVHASVHWAWSHEGEVGSWQYLHDMQRLTAGWRPSGPEWQEVVSMAATIGASRPVGWGCWFASRLGRLQVMDSMIAALRGRARLWQGVAEREWILRALYSPMASPSVAWSRYWWRRSMAGLGDARRAWPWALGHGAALARRAPGDGGDGVDGSDLVGTRVMRWRRHLGRVLGS